MRQEWFIRPSYRSYAHAVLGIRDLG